MILDNFAVVNDGKLVQYRIEKTSSFLTDLAYLLETNHSSLLGLNTVKYKKDFLQYQQQLKKLTIKLAYAKKNYQRNRGLFEKGVVAEVTFEKKKMAYETALSERNQFIKQKINSWQVERIKYENQLKELTNQLKQIKKTKKLYVLKAPVSGTILNFKGLQKGSFINAGQTLAEISPKTNLIVECLVSPTDIGFLKKK